MTLTRNEITERVIDNINSTIGIPKSEITLDSTFREEMGLDSLDTVELIMNIEKEFGLTVPDGEAATMDSVRNVVDFICVTKNVI